MLNEKQRLRLKEIAVPVLEWLDNGAPHRFEDHKDVGFNMNYMRVSEEPDYKQHVCGTTMCIAGALVEFNKDKFSKITDKSGYDAEDMVHDYVAGFHTSSLYYLFYPDSPELDYDTIKPEMAARQLRRTIEFGESAWDEEVG